MYCVGVVTLRLNKYSYTCAIKLLDMKLLYINAIIYIDIDFLMFDKNYLLFFL